MTPAAMKLASSVGRPRKRLDRFYHFACPPFELHPEQPESQSSSLRLLADADS